MKLKDVQKIATKGPLRIGYTLSTPQTRQWSLRERAINDRREAKMVFAAFTQADQGRSRQLVCDTNYGAGPEQERRANAALIVHHDKHFDKLLESLKSEVEGLKDDLCAVTDRPECPESIQIELGLMVASLHNRTIRIIREASEVEGL